MTGSDDVLNLAFEDRLFSHGQSKESRQYLDSWQTSNQQMGVFLGRLNCTGVAVSR
jgi:hypothetical protein